MQVSIYNIVSYSCDFLLGKQILGGLMFGTVLRTVVIQYLSFLLFPAGKLIFCRNDFHMQKFLNLVEIMVIDSKFKG